MKFATRLALLALLSLGIVLGLSSVASAAAPANDDFSAAKAVSGQSYFENPAIDLTEATVEPGETDNSPDSGNETRSIWFTWTAPASGYLNVASCNLGPGYAQNSIGIFKPDMATRLSGAIYASDGCGGSGGAVAGTLVTNGEQYWIRVAGSDETQVGNAHFALILTLPPDNDDIANAEDIGESANDTTGGNTAASTAEPGEGVQDSVWFKWNPPTDANYSIAVCSDIGGDVIARLYTAADPDNPDVTMLTFVDQTYLAGSCAADEGDYFTFGPRVAPQEPLWIQVSSADADQPANFTLTLSSSPIIGNPPSIDGDGALVGYEWEITSPGSWVGADPIGFTYRWDICDENGENCFTVPGEDGLTFDTTGWEDDLIGGTLRGGVQGGNNLGYSDFAQSEPSPVFDGDSDGDGVYDSSDACPQDDDGGSGKPNGCPTEALTVDTGPELSGTAVLGEIIAVDPGDVTNVPGIDPNANESLGSAIEWYACSAADDTDTCTLRTGSDTTYTITESNTPADSDGEKYIRARVTWTNGGDDTAELWTDATAKVVDKCPSDLQGTGKTNGCPWIAIDVVDQPSLSGTPQSGQTLTLTPGSAENNPSGLDPDVSAPIVVSRVWERCNSIAPDDCQELVDLRHTDTYPLTSADVGKRVRVKVTWFNQEEDEDVAVVATAVSAVITAPPAPPAPPVTPAAPTPLNLASLVFPKGLKITKLVKNKGKYTIKQVQVACPAGGPACVLTLSMTAQVKVKGKKKTLKLGNSKQTIPAGTTAPIKGTLSKSGLAAVRKAKSLKSTLTITGTGAAEGKSRAKINNNAR